MYRTTLIPTGGSEASFGAVADAIEVTASDGTIHVLGIVEDLPTHRRSGKPQKFDGGDDERVRLEAAVDRIAASVEEAGIDSVTVVEEGVPSHEIVEYAADADVDAIVMGKRGPSDAAADLLGSTTERVLRDAPTTVVSVPALD
jgi:nucleotide-binding universal stress UspA family protein